MTITLDELIGAAADLIGPREQIEDVDSEYIRAMVELIASFLPAPEHGALMAAGALGVRLASLYKAERVTS